jgi:DNA-binding CsgD family transcriptional regulator
LWLVTLARAASGMSLQEREVAVLVAAGHSDAAIAERLLISVPAVEWTVAKLSRTLGVESRDALTTLLADTRRA